MLMELVMNSITVRTLTNCGNLYITIAYSKENQPEEVFIALGKAGNCAFAQCEAISRLISIAKALEKYLNISHQKGDKDDLT